MAKIWGALIPMGHPIPGTQVFVNVNSFRDIMKNVLACAKILLKYRVLDVPWASISQESSLYVNSFRGIMKTYSHAQRYCKIWVLDGPMGHPYIQESSCNVNSFRDIMENVLLMQRYAKIWGASMIPGILTQEPSL
ncbi:hypothetical protein AVEN_211626-1 [Araneus ventricosus]|uniref:Uncharacterized protein n=1 Tax=Araneus ventricosus TaxID=182803 RepID=A0A4Y2RVA5_ARAVE|nr:hypothetical protein AVEN_211626-1 [Araneus ventricosus]